jgi:AbrB family looped-hinge helix DNA binding protein
MIKFMLMKTRLKITKGGQVSIPARIRHRWGTSTVSLSDEGHRIVLEPAADDPIAAAESSLADDVGRVDMSRLRRQARDDELAAEARRRKR